MENIAHLILRGYRLYKIDMRVTTEVRDFFKTRLGKYIEYYPHLKLIGIKDVQTESRL